MIRTLFALLLFLAGNLGAQSALRVEFEARLVRGDFGGARLLLGAISGGLSDPERSLLEAAAQEAPARAAAMLEVARVYPRHAVADRALAAAAAAVLLGRGRGDLVLGVEAREPDADEAWEKRGNLEAVAADLYRSIAARGDRDVRDRAAFLDAKRLDRVGRVRAIHAKPIRVGSNVAMPVPTPVAEGFIARVFSWSHGRSARDFAYRTESILPVAELVVDGPGYGRKLAALRAGEYMLELETRRTGGIVVRPLLVSDLELTAQRIDGAVVALVEFEGDPVREAVVRAATEGVRTNADGIAVLKAVSTSKVTVVAEHSGHMARTTLRRVSASKLATKVNCHATVDRPVYRRGEVVRGRLVVRAPELLECEGLAGVSGSGAELTPLVGEEFTVVAWASSGTPVRAFGTTDAYGSLTFELKVPETSKLGWVDLRVYRGRRPDALPSETLDSWQLFQVAAYRRAALMVELDGPAVAVPGREPVRLELRGRLASGAPASGCSVEIEGIPYYDKRQKQRGVLDGHGRLSIPVVMSDRYVKVVAKVTSPEGRVVEVSHEIAPESATSSRAELTIAAKGVAQAGADLRLQIRGPAGASALLCVARGTPIAARRVVFDSAGMAILSVALPEQAWPSVELYLATRDRRVSRRIETHAVGALASLALSTARNRYGPREEVVCKLQARQSDGRPVAGQVTLAVVDERIFAIAPDRTDSLRGALAPDVTSSWWVWAVNRGLRAGDPMHVLGHLLRDGKVWMGSSPGPGSAGPSSPGAASIAAATRADFRSTVFFSADVAIDADGRGEVRFHLPDGLTTYRLTAFAVDGGSGMAKAVHHIDTRQRLAVQPLLPRLLRHGDKVQLPVVIDRSAEGKGAAEVHVEDVNGVLAIADPRVEREITMGATEASIELAAEKVGEAQIRTSARVGRDVDATVHPRQVLADTVTVPVKEMIRFAGDREWKPKVADGQRYLTILGSRAAVLDACREYLGNYPHGCVEQTLSRILPFFATVRAGGRPAALDAGERQRLEKGLRRLRQLLVSNRRGFAWWPGGRVDDGMSALVVHGLVVAREGGLRLTDQGLQMNFRHGYVQDVARKLTRFGGRVTEGNVEAVELVVAALRFAPRDQIALLDAVQRVARRLQSLPAGLLGRIGLALEAAKDVDGATKVLQRLAKGHRLSAPADAWSRFPGEEPAAICATRLELAHALRDDSIDATKNELYTHFESGRFGSTYSTGCSIAALLLGAKGRQTVQGDQIVSIRNGTGFERKVTLTAKRSYRARLKVPTGTLAFHAGDDRELIALLTTEVTAPASRNPGWAEGLTVTRQLCRPGTKDLARPVRGQPIDVVVTVKSSRSVRYVVVTVPLPAGFEVGEVAGLDVFDERVVTTLAALPAGVAKRVRFTVVPGLAGRVCWPPAAANAMYAAACRGGSAGEVLEVGRRAAPRAFKPLRPFFAKRVKAVLRSPAQRAQDARDEQMGAFRAWCVDRCQSAGVSHAVAPTVAEAERRRLQELDAMFRGFPVEEQLRWVGEFGGRLTSVFGAAPGPLMQALGVWLQEQRERVCREIAERGELVESGRMRPLVAAYLEGLVHLGPAGKGRFLALVETILERGHVETLQQFLREHGESLRACGAADLCMPLLSHEDATVRRLAFGVIPDAMRRLPSVVIERAIGDEWDADEVRAYLQHPMGPERILALLRKPAFRDWVEDSLEEVLPAALIRRAPLACFEAECFGADSLAASAHASKNLEAELLRTENLGWRLNLLEALMLRGHDRLSSIQRESDLHHLYDDVLRANSGQRAAALRLRKRVWADQHGIRGLPIDPGFVVMAFQRDWTPGEFLEWAAKKERPQAILRRHSMAWRVRLIDTLGEQNWFPLDELPNETSPELAAALWRLGVRSEPWRDEVVEVLLRKPEDRRWLLSKIATLPDSEQKEDWSERVPEESSAWSTPRVMHRFGLSR